LELGSVPADRIPKGVIKPLWHGIVNGWVNPYCANSNYYVPQALQQEFGIPKSPLTYDRYVSFLLADEYKAHQSPDLYAAMLFALDEMARRNIPIPKTQDMIYVYQAGIGLEEEAIRLLAKSPLTPDDALALFEKFADVRLICLLKIPNNNARYLETIQAWSNKKDFDLYGRFLLKQLLTDASPQRFRDDLRNFTLEKVTSVTSSDASYRPDWWKRLAMYKALISIGDARCWEAINSGLLHDPVTETREQILVSLKKDPDSPRHVIDAVLMMTEGREGKHQSDTPCRMPAGYEYTLADYLQWANSLPHLEESTQEKIRKGMENLRRNPRTGGFILPEYKNGVLCGSKDSH
jgi:hypothetical protein